MLQTHTRQHLLAGLKSIYSWSLRSVAVLLIAGSSLLVWHRPAYTADAPPAYLLQWGNYGTNNGQFNEPNGVAVDSNGSIYVADTHNNRIQKFTGDGDYLLQWGTGGNGNGQFNAPVNLTVDSAGNVYVADVGNNRIQKFNSHGDYLLQWGVPGGGNGQFNSPWGVAVDYNSNIYVADTGNSRVQVFDSNGSYLFQWGTWGNNKGQFEFPWDVTVDGGGNVYVAEVGNQRIQKFSSHSEYITQWSSKGGRFSPYHVVADESGNVYASYGNNHQIQKFSSSGAYLTAWGVYGSANGQFSYPGAIAVDSRGKIYVADTFNNRIQKFGASVTKLTLLLDAQPLNSINFRFSGDLGDFKLREKKANDEKQVKHATVAPGTYTIAEQVPAGWYLNIACTPAGSGTVNLATNSVAISVVDGQEVTCVFTNQQSALVRALKYNDRNNNGRRNSGEPYLSGWTMDLYDNQSTPAPSGYTQCADEGGRCNFTGTKDVAYGANGVFYYRKAVTDGIYCNNDVFGDPLLGVVKACYIKENGPPTILVGRQVTNKQGKASFTNVRPGLLTICEIQQAGWFNIQPYGIDYTYGQPCYTQNVSPGMTATFTFGNTTTPPENSAGARATETGVILAAVAETMTDTATAVDEDAYPAPATDDAFLNTPEPETTAYTIYLPLIQQ